MNSGKRGANLCIILPLADFTGHLESMLLERGK